MYPGYPQEVTTIDYTHVSGVKFTDQKPILIKSSKILTDVINQQIFPRKASRVQQVSQTWETNKCIWKYQKKYST